MESPFKPDILEGKVALLTGGGSGIGYEISLQFGRHGAAVAIMGRRKQILDAAVSALQSHGIQAIGFDGDVRKKEDAARVVESTVKHFGRLDILVNAAAGNFLVSAEDLSPNGFKTVLDIDSVGTFTMCHEALKYLKKGGPGKEPSTGGIIVNISATLHYTASWYQIHVSAAKAAVDSITRSLALEWGTDYDIRVNGIAPGPIKDTAGLTKLAPQEVVDAKVLFSTHLLKYGEKWDIAMAALYLSCDAGSLPHFFKLEQSVLTNKTCRILILKGKKGRWVATCAIETENLGLAHVLIGLQNLSHSSRGSTTHVPFSRNWAVPFTGKAAYVRKIDNKRN